MHRTLQESKGKSDSLSKPFPRTQKNVGAGNGMDLENRILQAVFFTIAAFQKHRIKFNSVNCQKKGPMYG